jgi:hypothetical protein
VSTRGSNPLLSTEFLHRVKNEYACAISLTNILEAWSSNTPRKPVVFVDSLSGRIYYKNSVPPLQREDTSEQNRCGRNR